MFSKNKINRIRTFALALVFAGMIVMYGSFLVKSMWAVVFFLMLGLLMILASAAIYFWIGYISTNVVTVICPSCNKPTKILGKIDECMFCNQRLTLDPNLATDLNDTDKANEEKAGSQTP